jgi:GDP-L-fucose synthase
MYKRILTTGGNSFIAKNIVDKLTHHEVVCLPREELNLLDTKKVCETIKNGRPDVVIHTATYDAAPEFSTKDPKLVLENNLKMFYNVARCSDYFGKMIYFGSGAEFGRENWVPKMSEDYFDKNVPTDQYGLSKYIMTKHTLLSDNIFNLRLFGLFGEYDDWRYRFLPIACCKAVLGLPITIRQNARFDYLYIGDLIKVVEWFIQNEPKHKVYNVCSGEVYDYVELANKVLKTCGKKLDIDVQIDGLRDEYSGNNSRIKAELNEISFMKIDDAIEKLYGWYQKNKKMIKKELFVY